MTTAMVMLAMSEATGRTVVEHEAARKRCLEWLMAIASRAMADGGAALDARQQLREFGSNVPF